MKDVYVLGNMYKNSQILHELKYTIRLLGLVQTE